MNRRHFICTMGLLGLASTAPFAFPTHAAAVDRRARWAPSAKSPLLGSEWRYLAGQCTTGPSTHGFVVTLVMTKKPEKPLVETYQLLVEKINLSTNSDFVHAVYEGSRAFQSNIDRYIFVGDTDGVSASWEWDGDAGIYRLNLATPELRFNNLVLRPYGDLIPEGGNGIIDVGELTINGATGIINSSYHADWVQLEQPASVANMAIGTARLDMQSVYATGEIAESNGDYDHNWFAVQGELDGEPMYISAWRIESTRGPRWDVTIARRVAGTWTARSFSQSENIAQPLQVRPTSYQTIPNVVSGPNQTGASWHLAAGITHPNDLLDLEIAVAPGQFITGGRFGSNSQNSPQEAVGTQASGSVFGRPLRNVQLVIAESSAEAIPSSEFIPLAGMALL